MKTKMKATTRQDELMYAFDFTEEDLEVNREGKIFVGQGQKVMNRENKRWRIMIFGGLAIAAFFTSCPVFAWIVDGRLEGSLVFAGVIYGIGGLVGIGYGFHQWQLINSDFNVGKVEAVQGIAVIDADSRGKQVVMIGSLQLKAKRDALLRIKHLEPHIVYFLPRSKIIVSVEVVEN